MALHLVLLALLALALGLVAYVYLGYPLLLALIGRLRPRPVARGPAQPSVSLIVPAYNEDEVIGEKLANCLALDYPEERLEILVASDGSDDGTADVVASSGDRRVRFLDLPRRGKALALNDAAAAARHEILVFTDANVMLEPDALARLVESYADPEVGAVTGLKRMVPPAGSDVTAMGEGFYWRYENRVKEMENRVGSCYIGDGALHSVRRELYPPIDDPAQSDDMAISMRVVVAGHRLIFEPRAVVVEEATDEGTDEFRRKIRVTTHSLAALLNLGRHLWASGLYSFQLISHKLLRHLVGFFLIAALVSNIALVPFHRVYAASLAAQLLAYALAALGFALRAHPLGRAKLLAVPYYFCLVNAAATFGVVRLLRGNVVRMWTPRTDTGG